MYILVLCACSEKKEIRRQKVNQNTFEEVAQRFNTISESSRLVDVTTIPIFENHSEEGVTSYSEKEAIEKLLIENLSSAIILDRKLYNSYLIGFSFNKKAIKSRAPNLETAKGFDEAFHFLISSLNSMAEQKNFKIGYSIFFNIIDILEILDYLKDFLSAESIGFITNNLRQIISIFSLPDFLATIDPELQIKFIDIIESPSFWERFSTQYIKIFQKNNDLLKSLLNINITKARLSGKTYEQVFYTYIVGRCRELKLDEKIELSPVIKESIDIFEQKFKKRALWSSSIAYFSL